MLQLRKGKTGSNSEEQHFSSSKNCPNNDSWSSTLIKQSKHQDYNNCVKYDSN